MIIKKITWLFTGWDS